MNKKTMRILVEAGAIKKVKLVAKGARFHLEAHTHKDVLVAETGRGKVRYWSTLDAAAKWVRSVGIGQATLVLDQWQPEQQEMQLSGSVSENGAQGQMDV